MLWTSTRGPITSKNRGIDLDLHTAVCELSHHGEQILGTLGEEGEDDAIDVQLRDQRRQVLGSPEQGEITESRVPLARARIDEAHDVGSVLGVVEQLAGDELAHLAGADDHGVLAVAAVPLAERAGDGAKQRDEADRARPEEQQARNVRVRQARQPGEHEDEPGTNRDEHEDADEVVGP